MSDDLKRRDVDGAADWLRNFIKELEPHTRGPDQLSRIGAIRRTESAPAHRIAAALNTSGSSDVLPLRKRR